MRNKWINVNIMDYHVQGNEQYSTTSFLGNTLEPLYVIADWPTDLHSHAGCRRQLSPRRHPGRSWRRVISASSTSPELPLTASSRTLNCTAAALGLRPINTPICTSPSAINLQEFLSRSRPMSEKGLDHRRHLPIFSRAATWPFVLPHHLTSFCVLPINCGCLVLFMQRYALLGSFWSDEIK